MKLVLKNFRCYTNQTFEFNDDHITLINGPSGHGKTTILLAIQFALCGLTNYRYLISYNKNSCEVNLVYKKFNIKRTKRPNILNVEVDGHLYEDKEAQVIINKYFGAINSSAFFIDMSHLEKMEFLEKIVNGDCDVKDLKIKIKNEISYLNKELAILDSQILNTESMLDIVQKPKKIDKPSKEVFFNDLNNLTNLSKKDLILKKEQTTKQLEQEKLNNIKYNGLMVELKVIKDEISSLGYLNDKIHECIESLNKKLYDLKEKNKQFNKLKENFLIAEDCLKELKNYEHFKENDYHDINKKINALERKIKQCAKADSLRIYNDAKIEYEEALNQEMFEWQQKVEFCQTRIGAARRRKDGDEESTDKIQNVESDLSSDLKNLEQTRVKFELAHSFNSKHSLNDILDQIEALKLKFFKSYKCNNCNHKIVINMDTFEIETSTFILRPFFSETSDNLNEKMFNSTTKDQLQKLNVLRDKFEQNDEFMQTININKIKDDINLIKEHIKLKEDLFQIGSFKPSTMLTKMQKKVLKLGLQLPLLVESDEDETETENTGVEGDLNGLKDKKRDLTVQLNELSQQLRVKNNLLNKINNIRPYDASTHSNVLRLLEECVEETKEKSIELEKFKNKKRLESKLADIKTQIAELNFDKETVLRLEQFLNAVELGLQYHQLYNDYKNFHIQLNKYKKVKETLTNFKTTKENMERTYLKTLLFKQKVIESEHESLQFMINIINTHLSILLQDFFSESFGDPIQIYLELINDTRPQVNTVINYKGNSVDYKSLSTGEYARVKLAFDLTFKEILGENIIMLDECAANLDQDLSTKIFNKIKTTFPSKTILVVAHQVVMGSFDHVLNINNALSEHF